MRAIVRHRKPIGYLLIVAVFCLSVPRHPAWAAMVSTESVIAPAAGMETGRARVRAFLDREDVRAQIEAYGVDADEAAARIDTLTDREIALIAGRQDELPAGGGAHGAVGHVLPALLLLPFVLILKVACVIFSEDNCETVDEDTFKDDAFKYDPPKYTPLKDDPFKDDPSGR